MLGCLEPMHEASALYSAITEDMSSCVLAHHVVPPMPDLAAVHRELGISPGLVVRQGLKIQLHPGSLHAVDRSIDNRPVLLEPDTAIAWREMKQAAARDGIQLNAESGFRSVQEQAAIIKRLLAEHDIEKVLTRVAAPGYSEHHSGCAVDIANNTALIHPLGQSFDQTDTFRWLSERAERFGFRMSYPLGNPHGIMYEPWHWCFHNKKQQ